MPCSTDFVPTKTSFMNLSFFRLTLVRGLFLSFFPVFLFAPPSCAQDINDEAVPRSLRSDGRLQSTYAIAHRMLSRLEPRHAWHEGMSRRQTRRWQRDLSRAMRGLMRFPKEKPKEAPRLVSSSPREGYTLEKWEFYPFPEAVASFLVLLPDTPVSTPLPAVLCIPGSGGTKEGLCGEKGVWPALNENVRNPRVTMALHMVRAGYVAVAVDNAAAGEQSDLERYGRGWDYDYDLSARLLLEMGWSWLGYTSYLDYLVLRWMEQEPRVRRDRIVVSGFSLGTEPMMVLGALDRSIHAFVYNDFLCQTQERTLVMTCPESNGRRPFPNSIRHLIPLWWDNFNFPDVMASLAPRPVIFTEGGLDRDFRTVRGAYRAMGAGDKVETHHYPKFSDPKDRIDDARLPEGLSREEFFRRANVDPPSHYFKKELIMPWLQKVMQ